MSSIAQSWSDFVSTSLTFKSIFLISPIVFAAFLLLSFASRRPSQKNQGPVALPISCVSSIIPFFRQRYDFLEWGFKITSEPIFQFHLLRMTVIALSGENGRKAFLTTKSFDLHSGFKDLLGGIPLIKGVTSDLHGKTVNTIYRRLAMVQNPDRLAKMVPQVLNDCSRVMQTWGRSGALDPFNAIYELVFQLTVRCISSGEIADDTARVHELRGLYNLIDEGNTPATILLPWFPTWGMLKKLYATWRIFYLINKTMKDRIKSGKRREDNMQMLLDSGDDKMIVVGFTMGLIIAGSRSTGTTASWLITFLGHNDEWKAKATAEVKSLLDSTGASPGEDSSLTSLSASLSRIPLETWELRTPVLDLIIAETLRLAQPHTAMRRNLGPELRVDGKVIPSGAYVLYPFSDVHLNSDLYSDPWTFDPSRPRHKTAFSWIGFGGGKNVCLGQRLAKLELKLISAMFLLGFDYHVIDETGNVPNLMPKPNWNDILGCKPPKGTCLLDYRVR